MNRICNVTRSEDSGHRGLAQAGGSQGESKWPLVKLATQLRNGFETTLSEKGGGSPVGDQQALLQRVCVAELEEPL